MIPPSVSGRGPALLDLPDLDVAELGPTRVPLRPVRLKGDDPRLQESLRRLRVRVIGNLFPVQVYDDVAPDGADAHRVPFPRPADLVALVPLGQPAVGEDPAGVLLGLPA